jgi:capsular exopolysaccharide synthesis family protein
MMHKTGKNYYDMLDVQPDADREDIDAAYRRAKATYGEDSVALYSLYSREEKDAILEEIEEAYETLSDKSKKETYDAVLSVAHQQEGLTRWEAESAYKDKAATDHDAGPGETTSTLTLKDGLHSMDEMDPIAAEQYRVLYTKLEHISLKQSYKVFAVTSAVKGEGKTVTSLNLAYVMAHDFKKKVVVVECDLRKPSLLNYFSGRNGSGSISDAIRGGADVMSVISRIKDTSLYLIPATQSTSSSAELLGSQKMKAVIETLKREFDYVIIDSPPILHMADMNIIARIVDGLILVVRAGKTPKDIVVKAARSLQNANIVGIVLNGAEVSLNKYYYR